MKNQTKESYNCQDIFDHLCLVSKEAIIFFNKLKNHTNNQYGIVVFNERDNMSQEEYDQHEKLLAELINNNIICDLISLRKIIPIEPDSYMINPNLLRPKQYKEAVKYWNQANE